MFALFVSELNYYISKEVQQELFVDTSKGQKLQINIDVTFSKVGCSCKYSPSGFSNNLQLFTHMCIRTIHPHYIYHVVLL